MLREVSGLSQEETGYRRLFSDEYFDLYLWYDRKGGALIGFQLCYDKEGDEHSLTWVDGKGYLHSRIDSGDSIPSRSKQSPVLVRDGYFDKEAIAERFERESANLSPEIVDLVTGKILDFSPDKIDPLL